ncbi:hypothetical protein MW887_000063 [Aspergillus wentii]|nr:hypothetical protein MW887_000063 [Aspergillus wentii]
MSDSIESQIAALTSSVQSNQVPLDDAARLKAINAAQGLLDALKSPVEIILQDVVMNPPQLMAIRMGVQFGVFKQIASNPTRATTTKKIAEESKASVILCR